MRKPLKSWANSCKSKCFLRYNRIFKGWLLPPPSPQSKTILHQLICFHYVFSTSQSFVLNTFFIFIYLKINYACHFTLHSNTLNYFTTAGLRFYLKQGEAPGRKGCTTDTLSLTYVHNFFPISYFFTYSKFCNMIFFISHINFSDILIVFKYLL